MNPDDDLRKLFATLRERDLRDAPAFAAAATRRAPSPRRWRGPALRWAIAAAAIASLAIVLARPLRRAAPAQSLSAWRAPTDFLLKTPGFEMLTLGPRWPPLPAAPGRLPSERRRSS